MFVRVNSPTSGDHDYEIVTINCTQNYPRWSGLCDSQGSEGGGGLVVIGVVVEVAEVK